MFVRRWLRRPCFRRTAPGSCGWAGPERLEPRLALTALPAGFAENVVAAGLVNPVAMEFAPDGRLFVLEQAGRMRIVDGGALLPTPALTLDVNTYGERGLLGLAFDPEFAENQYLYVFYTTATAPLHNRVSRFTASGNSVLPDSELVLLDMDPLGSAGNHNGGPLAFGADGKLYVSAGDNRVSANSQTLTNLLGKILRIGSDGGIPPDNPYYNSTSGANRAIYALGLRNVYSLDVQPGTGRIFVNDVGETAWEEINELVPGADYGWPVAEGTAGNPLYRDPLLAYGHGSGSTEGCAIAGGAFYNPSTPNFPAGYEGKYFFLDFCSGWVRQLDPATNLASDFASSLPAQPVALRLGPDGALYYTTYGAGASIYRISYPGAATPPAITAQPADRLASLGQQATFAVSAAGTAPLAYQWSKDGQVIAGASGPSYTIGSVALSDAGSYSVLVSNALASVSSNPATLTATSDQPPTASIAAPADDSLYTAGQTINFSGWANDPETGALLASALTWRVDFHHGSHFHPFLPPTSGIAGGSFVVPVDNETSADVWYRVHLTAQDPAGLVHSSYRDVLPRTASLTIGTNPPGLTYTLDGQPAGQSQTLLGVAGIVRSLSAPAVQLLDNVYYQFDSWSDQGAATHQIATPATAAIYTANFRPLPAYWQSTSGSRLVVVEAEHAAATVARSGHGWSNVAPGGSSGGAAMQALPNSGLNINSSYAALSPRMDFPIYFTRTGTHYVWVRGLGTSSADDSLHVGLDGLEVASADKLHGFNSSYKWSRATGDGDTAGYLNPATINVAAPGLHVVNLWMREDGMVVDKLLITPNYNYRPGGKGPAESFSVDPGPLAAYQQQSDEQGLVSIEAEHYDAMAVRSAHAWSPVVAAAGSEGVAMQASPNTGLNVTANYAQLSPRLDYAVNFTRTGLHYVWVRGLGASSADDTLHVGLDGVELPSADKLNGFVSGFRWSRSTGDGDVQGTINPATIQVDSTGLHTLNLWMREDGMLVDKIVLSTDADYVPTGFGPAESVRLPTDASGTGSGALAALGEPLPSESDSAAARRSRRAIQAAPLAARGPTTSAREQIAARLATTRRPLAGL